MCPGYTQTHTHTDRHMMSKLLHPSRQRRGVYLSYILFIFYIRTMTCNIPSHIKYADDVTAMATHEDPDAAALNLSNNLTSIVEWNRKWRLTANPKKSEVMCFSRRGDVKVSVYMGGTLLKQVTVKPCLGVLLDNNLTLVLSHYTGSC